METRELANHPGMWMRADAATQFDYFETVHGIMPVNRAGVSVSEQREVIDRWNTGGAANRPPNLYEPKQPPEASEHVQGVATDINAPGIPVMLEWARPFGFYRRYAWDKPHFEFDPKRVTKRAPNTVGKPPAVSNTISTGDDMIIELIGKVNVRSRSVWLLTRDSKGKSVAIDLGPKSSVDVGIPFIGSQDKVEALAKVYHGLKV